MAVRSIKDNGLKYPKTTEFCKCRKDQPAHTLGQNNKKLSTNYIVIM